MRHDTLCIGPSGPLGMVKSGVRQTYLWQFGPKHASRLTITLQDTLGNVKCLMLEFSYSNTIQRIGKNLPRINHERTDLVVPSVWIV